MRGIKSSHGFSFYADAIQDRSWMPRSTSSQAFQRSSMGLIVKLREQQPSAVVPEVQWE
jgi:hypothetical protein